MTQEALIIFMRNPERGKVKTRIAVEAGEDKALEIYLKLLDITLQTALKVDCQRFLYTTGQIVGANWDSDYFQNRIQCEGDLGARMFSAFREVLVSSQSALIIGSDCPWLNAKQIREAFDALHTHDLVIGPARDGGYYLLGMSKPCEPLFQGISWSSENVLQETLYAADKSGLNYFLLQTLSDVDYLEDWRDYEEEQRLNFQ